MEKTDIEVRLQWDPDHKPDYTKESRRAIQLGLKGEASHGIGYSRHIFLVFSYWTTWPQ